MLTYTVSTWVWQLLQSFQERFPHLHFPDVPVRGDLKLTEVLDAPYFFNWLPPFHDSHLKTGSCPLSLLQVLCPSLSPYSDSKPLQGFEAKLLEANGLVLNVFFQIWNLWPETPTEQAEEQNVEFSPYMNIISNQTIYDQFSGAKAPDISISIMAIVWFLLMDSSGAGETQFNGCCFYSLKVRLNCLAKVLLTLWIVQKCKLTSIFLQLLHLVTIRHFIHTNIWYSYFSWSNPDRVTLTERIAYHLHCIIITIQKPKSDGPCARSWLTPIIDGIPRAAFADYCFVALVDAHNCIEL